MRRSEFCRLSLKGWRRLYVPAILFFIAALYLGATAWEGYLEVRQEKRQPCRLTASVSAPLSDVGAVAELEGIEAVSLVYPVSVTMQIQNYQEECVLTGVDASFVEGGLLSGSLYPEQTAMPYILLNEAALSALVDGNGKPIADIDTVEWLNAAVRLKLGESAPVTARICGILGDENAVGGEGADSAANTAAPVCYISQEAAKSLLRQTGADPGTDQLWLDIVDSGAQESVEIQLGSLGITAENVDEEAGHRWELKTVTAQYRGVAALAALLAAAALLHDRIRLDTCLEREEYARLQETGLCRGDVRKTMNAVRLAGFVLLGILGAVLVSLSAPIVIGVLGQTGG